MEMERVRRVCLCGDVCMPYVGRGDVREGSRGWMWGRGWVGRGVLVHEKKGREVRGGRTEYRATKVSVEDWRQEE